MLAAEKSHGLEANDIGTVILSSGLGKSIVRSAPANTTFEFAFSAAGLSNRIASLRQVKILSTSMHRFEQQNRQSGDMG